jgi:hypothetical protein
MATRKQRARRAKTFRHDYGFVTYDEEGNEVEVEAAEIRPKKDEPAKQKAGSSAKSSSKGGSRATREPQPPSWSRSLRRGALWGGATIAASVLLLRGTPLPGRVLIGAAYAAMFIPLTYWMDGVIYRRYEKKKAAAAASRSSRTR